MGSPELPPQVPKAEDEKLNRRRFLLGAAGLAGAAVAGKVGMEMKVETEKSYEGQGIILSKEYTPSRITMPVAGKPSIMVPVPEKFSITISVDGRTGTLLVSKEEFESYKEGDSVAVVYENKIVGQGLDITSVKKEE